MKDLWRHISGMETRLKDEIQGVREELKDEIQGAHTELKDEIQKVRSEMKDGFADLNGQTQGIREVVDTLASQDDFDSLDRKISAVSADTQATRQAVHDVKADVSRLRQDVKKAGILVR